MPIYTSRVVSPVGELSIAVDQQGRLLRIDFAGREVVDPLGVPDDGRCRHVASQLQQYFAGELLAFALDLLPAGTDFQRRAWQALLSIPFGSTISYAEQARRIGRPQAQRAIGAANGRNPIPIVVPCHRVIGKDGSLTGFGGGLDRKRWLLEHEARVAKCQRAAAAG